MVLPAPARRYAGAEGRLTSPATPLAETHVMHSWLTQAPVPLSRQGALISCLGACVGLLGACVGLLGACVGLLGAWLCVDGVSENVVRYAVNAQPRPHRLEVRRHQAATPPPRRHAATGDKYAALSPTGARVMHDGLLAPPPGPNSPALRRARRSSSPRQTTAPRPRVRSGCRGVRLRRGPRRPSGQRRTRAVDQLYSFSKRSSSSSREWYFVSGTNLM